MIALEKMPPESRSMAVKPDLSILRHALKRTGEAQTYLIFIPFSAADAGKEER